MVQFRLRAGGENIRETYENRGNTGAEVPVGGREILIANLPMSSTRPGVTRAIDALRMS
jgi:hypothetical protein